MFSHAAPGTFVERPDYEHAQKRHLCYWCGEQGVHLPVSTAENVAYAIERKSVIFECPNEHIFFVESQYLEQEHPNGE